MSSNSALVCLVSMTLGVSNLAMPCISYAAPPPASGDEREVGGDADPATAAEFEPPDPSLSAAERATAWFVRGDQLRGAADFASAALAYDASFAAQASSQALYNAALAYERAQQAPQAWMRWQAFVQLDGIDDAEREAARDRVSSLAALTSGLVVLLSAPSARDPPLPLDASAATQLEGSATDQLFLDEVAIVAGTNLRLWPGLAQLERRRGSTVVSSLELELLAGETLTVDWRAPPGAALVPEGPVDRPAQNDGSQSRARLLRFETRQAQLGRASIALTALTALSGIATIGLGVGTIQERRQYQEGVMTEGCQDQAPCYPDDHERRFAALRTATNAMVVVTALVGAAAVSTAIVWGAARWSGRRGDTAWAPGRRYFRGATLHF